MPRVGGEGVVILNKAVMEALIKVTFEQSPKGACKPHGAVGRTLQAEVTSYVKALRQEHT